MLDGVDQDLFTVVGWNGNGNYLCLQGATSFRLEFRPQKLGSSAKTLARLQESINTKTKQLTFPAPRASFKLALVAHIVKNKSCMVTTTTMF